MGATGSGASGPLAGCPFYLVSLSWYLRGSLPTLLHSIIHVIFSAKPSLMTHLKLHPPKKIPKTSSLFYFSPQHMFPSNMTPFIFVYGLSPVTRVTTPCRQGPSFFCITTSQVVRTEPGIVGAQQYLLNDYDIQALFSLDVALSLKLQHTKKSVSC